MYIVYIQYDPRERISAPLGGPAAVRTPHAWSGGVLIRCRKWTSSSVIPAESRSKGCFVAPQNRELLREAQLRRVEEKLTQAIEEARRGAVSLEELKEMLTELYQEV